MEKWEYKIINPEVKGWVDKRIDPESEQQLNELGNQGWELVSIAHLTSGAGGGWGGDTKTFIFIFKRKKT